MQSILDPSFKYTSSVNTDIAKTFARIRRAQREKSGAAIAVTGEMANNVSQFDRRARANSKVA